MSHFQTYGCKINQNGDGTQLARSPVRLLSRSLHWFIDSRIVLRGSSDAPFDVALGSTQNRRFNAGEQPSQPTAGYQLTHTLPTLHPVRQFQATVAAVATLP